VALSDVQEVLTAKALECLSSFGDAVEVENETLTRLDGEKWAQVFFMPADPQAFTLGNIGMDKVEGILQLTLKYPRCTGSEEASVDCAATHVTFPSGLLLVADSGQEVRIVSCQESPGSFVDNWYAVYVSVHWSAFLLRA
jgi:hypothetical protein